jgi:N-formylglutamate deformylase
MMKETHRVDPPAAALSPVVYDSPHSGRTYPIDFNHAIDLATLRQAEDTHVEALFARVTHFGSPLLYALFQPRAR